MKKKNERGITLIALIITIIVMLILVAVVIRTAINSGLFGHAKNATDRWADAQEQEGMIGSGNDIEDTVNKYTGGDNNSEEDYPEPTNPDYFTYEFDEETKTATLTGVKTEYEMRSIYKYGGRTDYLIGIKDGEEVIKNIVIPSEVEYEGTKYTVNRIVDGCFKAESSARYESLFESFYIPSSIKSIGERVFYGCGRLTSVNIASGVTSIGDSAFNWCSNLTSINIPNSVTNIGNSAFSDCSNLTSINIPNSVTNIGSSAFSNCSNLTNINIPSSVTSIGDYTFRYCSNLTSINIPDSVTNIGNSAFSNCSNLTNINIPSSVTSIGSSAFGGCGNLTSINVDTNNTNYTDIEGVLSNKAKTQLIKYPEGKEDDIYTIPNGVTSIGNSAFSDCSNLTSINIPNSVTSIGNSAFSYCRNLTNINIPSSVTSVGSSAFMYCNNLTSINIPSSVTGIGDGAFWGWNSSQTINCQASEKPAGWIATSDYSKWNRNCNATINWGVSM